MQYTVIVERSPRNFSAYVPDLPGCVATSATREGAIQSMKEAIRLHIEGLRGHEEPVPDLNAPQRLSKCERPVADMAGPTAARAEAEGDALCVRASSSEFAPRKHGLIQPLLAAGHLPHEERY